MPRRDRGAGTGRPSAPDLLVTPGGTAFPVPQGATGPIPVLNRTGHRTGTAFTGGRGGAKGHVDTIRVCSLPLHEAVAQSILYTALARATGHFGRHSTGERRMKHAELIASGLQLLLSALQPLREGGVGAVDPENFLHPRSYGCAPLQSQRVPRHPRPRRLRSELSFEFGQSRTNSRQYQGRKPNACIAPW